MRTLLSILMVLMLFSTPLWAQQNPPPPSGALQNNTSSATSNGTPLFLGGLSPVTAIQASGTFSSATFTIQSSVDNSNWVNTTCYTMDSLTPLNLTGWVTAAGGWFCHTPGVQWIRAAIASGTPGGVTIVAGGSQGGVAALNPGSAIAIPFSSNCSRDSRVTAKSPLLPC